MLPRGVVRFLAAREARSRTPSERAGQKSDPDARRGGLAARAPLRQDFAGQADLTPASLPKSLTASRKDRHPGLLPCASSASESLSGFSSSSRSPVAGIASPRRLTGRGNVAPRLRVEFPKPWSLWAEMPRNLKWSGLGPLARTYFDREYVAADHVLQDLIAG
jgi:hypothetical protein